MTSIYTIGHSDRSQTELVDLLKQNGVATLVDIRSNPHSKKHPHFDDEVLRNALTKENIVYHWAGRQLGGLRQGSDNSIHSAIAPGLRHFADYMATSDFERAASQLQNLAAKGVIAMLCAEKTPDLCHRSLIADHLLLNGMDVAHIIDDKEVISHCLRPEARRESATLVYDQII
ncbi:MAG: DUF488 domain-containing protein [Proteobacteria bacterium]|nr:DUF488 domain-containing protein [Pseudomonadota bacterium]